MAKRIYKYDLGKNGETVVIRGRISRFLDIKYQPGQGMKIWVEIDDSCREVHVPIVAIGTGWELPDIMKYWTYLGSEIDNMDFVWHYYRGAFAYEKNEIGE